MENLVLHKRGCDILARFGRNPHNQPLYRMVRTDSRRQWIMGEFRPKYPKYGSVYVIETWCSPEKYGSQLEWEDAKDENGVSLLGPYPRQGDYEFVIPVMDANGNMLTEPGEHHLMAMGMVISKSQNQTRSQRWAQIQEAQAEAERVKRKKLEDMIHDARPLRGGEAERKYGEAMEEAAKRMPETVKTGASLRV